MFSLLRVSIPTAPTSVCCLGRLHHDCPGSTWPVLSETSVWCLLTFLCPSLSFCVYCGFCWQVVSADRWFLCNCSILIFGILAFGILKCPYLSLRMLFGLISTWSAIRTMTPAFLLISSGRLTILHYFLLLSLNHCFRCVACTCTELGFASQSNLKCLRFHR